MLEKIKPKSSKRKSKKVLALAAAAALGVGAGHAEKAGAHNFSADDLNSLPEKKPIEKKSSVDPGEAERKRLENELGVNLDMPREASEENSQDKKSLEERDYLKDFDLGVDISGVDMSKGTPETRIIRLLEGKYYLGSESVRYKEAAFSQMLVKYGKERFNEVIEVLKEISPLKGKYDDKKIIEAYQHSFSQFGGASGRGDRVLNRKLYNLADLFEAGNAEKLAELFKLLRSEGYKRMHDFSWDMEKIEAVLADPEERKALIEYTDKMELFDAEVIRDNVKLTKDEYARLSYKDRMKLVHSLEKLGKFDKK